MSKLTVKKHQPIPNTGPTSTPEEVYIFYKEVEMITPSDKKVLVLQEESKTTLSLLARQKDLLETQVIQLQDKLNAVNEKIETINNLNK